MIIVCPYDRIDAAMAEHHAGRAISILDTADGPGIEGIAPENHLRINYSMADAVRAPSPCGAAKTEEDRIRKIIEFARSHDWQSPLLIHCRLGLCRSPAAAFIIQCALSPEKDEAEIARSMRALSDDIEPSLSMVAQADCLLERGGRMIDALDAMGGGAACAGDILDIPYRPEPA